MKESIGQAFLVNLILIFFLVLILMLLGSINYSKAYKVKNRIITIIEKYGTDAEADAGGRLSDEVKNEINVNLKKAGFANSHKPMGCEKYTDGGTLLYPEGYGGSLNYHYCVIRIDAEDGSYKTPSVSGVTYKGARYYKVVTFMEFDIPLLGGYLKFPVQGETKIIYDVIS